MLKSHPDKLLIDHLNGVLLKTQNRSNDDVAKYAAMFHDFGKINSNFQNKLYGENTGYSDHSYLSCYLLLHTLTQDVNLRNELSHMDIYNILNIIRCHHTHIHDISNIFNLQSIKDLDTYLKNTTDDFLNFIEKNYNFNINNLSYDEKVIKSLSSITQSKIEKLWMQNSLDNFFKLIFSFSSVVESDKRDAANYNEYNFSDNITSSINNLNVNLNNKLNNLKLDSDLNVVRTNIRNDAVLKINNCDDRVFSITAPTGSGKTFMMLKLANELQMKYNNLGIIYCLPFLSIIDQTVNICENDLNMDILSKTSSSVEKVEDDISVDELLKINFQNETFDHPFIITTFVQFFETLISNRNNKLLKLPNFSNRIFLIDEIQSLPPRLYIFFQGLLQEFCQRYNSYAILSTATMPNFNIIEKTYVDDIKRADLLFKNYKTPKELIDSDKYYNVDVFDRYKINSKIQDNYTLIDLGNDILDETSSTLIILNTVKDSINLYDYLKFNNVDNLYLLNSNFIVDDRIDKIDTIKKKLNNNERVVLVSTQLIEAGVDIDFPVLYRDICSLPSLIQSAGRCNRNNKIECGDVNIVSIDQESERRGKTLIDNLRAKYIYDRKDLEFIINNFDRSYSEKELFTLQKKYYNYISENLSIGEYYLGKDKMNMIELVNSGKFEELGKFKLIDNVIMGEECSYYINKNDFDTSFSDLNNMISDSNKDQDFLQNKAFKIGLSNKIKQMQKRIVKVRYKDDENKNEHMGYIKSLNLYLTDDVSYNSEIGFIKDGDSII
jgi:CRISPR-associated endonuclease/helicase Cas3